MTHTSNLIGCIEMALNRHQIEKQLAAETLQAQEKNENKSKFIASISHEIRTPLNILLGTADILAESLLTPAQRQHVDTLRRAGSNLNRLVSDVLDLAKAESGQLELENVPFDLYDLVEGVVHMIEIAAKEKNLVLTLEVEPGLPRYVSGDPTRFER